MSRFLLLLIIQLSIVLSQRRYQGMSSRLSSQTRRTRGFSVRRQGRNQDDGSADLNSVSDSSEVFDTSDDDDLFASPEAQDDPAEQTASVSSMDRPSTVSGPEAASESSKSDNLLAIMYPSYADRCGTCDGEEDDPVCGLDGHTYPNMCIPEHYA